MSAGQEEWRQVPGFPDYFVSDTGKVLSHRRKRPQLLKPAVNPCGYWVVNVFDANGQVRTRRVHRLVLLAFVGPCPEGMEACHADGDRLNAHLSNLRWGTPSDNAYDRVRHGTHNMASKTHCLRGHLYDERNTGWQRKGTARYCLTCSREASRRNHIRRVLATANVVEVAA